MHQFLPLLLLLRLLKRHHYIQQLVSQTHQCDCEVNDHGLTHHLWRVLGVRQLGGEVELEVLVVVDEVVSQLDVFLPCSLDDVSLQEGVQSRV